MNENIRTGRWAFCLLRGYYIYVQLRSLPAAPRDFFVSMKVLGAPSLVTLSWPMPAKSRRKSASPTPRSRGGSVPVVRSPGAHGFRQLLRCPRKPTKRCGSVHSFFLGENIVLTIGYDYCVVHYIPRRHGIPRERTGPISAHDTPLSAPCSPPREIWRSADVYCCCCIFLLLLLLSCGYCCYNCCFYCCNCCESVIKQSRRFETGRL